MTHGRVLAFCGAVTAGLVVASIVVAPLPLYKQLLLGAVVAFTVALVALVAPGFD